MPTAFHFRPATQLDAEAITRLYLYSRKRFLPFAPVAHSDETVYQWMRDTVISAQQVTVAEQATQIIAMMAVSKNANTKIGWIEQLYLHPDFVDQGIGYQLVELKLLFMSSQPIAGGSVV